MSITYKYQEQFASDLTNKWLAGQRTEVRITIRQLRKAQAAYIAAQVAVNLMEEGKSFAQDFAIFIHPNQ
jgi:hypothetical protein